MGVPKITLRDGSQIPSVGYGLGTANYGKDSKDAVLLALEEGYLHIDSAEAYENAPSLGAALKETKVPRSDIWITAKCTADPRKALKSEMDSFGVDSVDLFLLHSPEWVTEGIEKAWAECEALQDEGLTKSIGVSNFRVKDLEVLLRTAKTIPVVDQIEVHPYVYTKAKAIIEFCHEHSITIEVYGPLTPITKASGGELDAVVQRIGNRIGYNPAQVLLKWAQQVTRGVVITTSSKSSRLREQLVVFTEMPDLSERDVQDIIKAGSSQHFRGFMPHMDE